MRFRYDRASFALDSCFHGTHLCTRIMPHTLHNSSQPRTRAPLDVFPRCSTSYQEKMPLTRARCAVQKPPRVTTSKGRRGIQILMDFPFPLAPLVLCTSLDVGLGSADSHPITVLVKPFSSSAHTSLTCVLATTTKICATGRSIHLLRCTCSQPARPFTCSRPRQQ